LNESQLACLSEINSQSLDGFWGTREAFVASKILNDLNLISMNINSSSAQMKADE
jgi:hypothetical protein